MKTILKPVFRLFILISAGLFLFPCFLTAEIKRVLIIPFSHQDIGFTATQREISDVYVETYNALPSIMEKFPDFKFTIETFWQFEQWLKSGPDEELLSFYLDMIKKGRIEFCGAYGSMHTGFMNEATLNATIERGQPFFEEYGIPVNTCMMNDVLGYCQDLPDILADHGISYFMSGVNAGFKGDYAMDDTEGLYYWEGPGGGRVLTWVPEFDYMQAITYKSTSNIDQYVQEMEDRGYPYDTLPIMAAHDNRGFRPGFKAYLDLVMDKIFLKDIEVVVGTPSDFFEHVEEKYSDQIPVKKGDWSGWWEVTKAGGPFSAGMVRWAQQCYEDLEGRGFFPSDEEGDEILENLLTYLEHANHGTAGWPGLLTEEQLYVSNKTVVDYAENAYNGLYGYMSDTLKKKAGWIFKKNVVFNPSEEERLVPIRFGSDRWSPDRTAMVSLNDKIYRAYPFSLEYDDPWEPVRQGWEFSAVLPPGFSRFKILETEVLHRESEESLEIENGYYRITLGPSGEVCSLYDLVRDKEISGNGFGRLASALHGMVGVDRSLTGVLPGNPSPKVERLGDSQVMTVTWDEGPLVSCRIVLPDDQPVVEFHYLVDRSEFEFVPYSSHSMDYYLEFPLSGELRISDFRYSGPASYVGDMYEFSRARPVLIAVKDNMFLSGTGYTLGFASRHAFMAHMDTESVYYNIATHFSECATNDKGITRMRDIEPGTGDILPFSFCFSTFDEIASDRFVSFTRPAYVWTKK